MAGSYTACKTGFGIARSSAWTARSLWPRPAQIHTDGLVLTRPLRLSAFCTSSRIRQWDPIPLAEIKSASPDNAFSVARISLNWRRRWWDIAARWGIAFILVESSHWPLLKAKMGSTPRSVCRPAPYTIRTRSGRPGAVRREMSCALYLAAGRSHGGHIK